MVVDASAGVDTISILEAISAPQLPCGALSSKPLHEGDGHPDKEAESAEHHPHIVVLGHLRFPLCACIPGDT